MKRKGLLTHVKLVAICLIYDLMQSDQAYVIHLLHYGDLSVDVLQGILDYHGPRLLTPHVLLLLLQLSLAVLLHRLFEISNSSFTYI